MADIVPVNPSASYTVWAEDFASSGVLQRVKVVLGAPDVDGGNVGATNPMPVSGTVSAVVSGVVSVSAMPAVSGTVSVINGVSVSAQVAGTVSVSGAVQVSGAVSVSAMPAVSISVSAVLGTVVTVLGTLAVNVVAGGAAPGTTAATQSAISAQVVWLAPTQTISATVNTIAAGFSVQALVTGVVSVSAMPAVSGTVTVNISGIVPVTTAASVSVSGLPVWLNATQAVVVNTIAAGFSVNALVTGPVSISALPAISISVSAVLGTIITQLGTQIVSVVPGVSVNALVTGPVSISAMPAVSISVSAALGTVITVLGTQVVTVALLNFTTATPTVTATGPIVWLANTVTVTVTATVTGSLIISGIVPVTTAASVSVSAIPVWLNPTQGVNAVVTGPVSISAIAASQVLGTIIAVSGVSAVSVLSTVVTILGTQIITAVGSPGFNAVHIEITSTAIAISAAAYVFTIWTGLTGAPVAAATTAFVVPAGKTLRLLNMQGIINSSAVTGGTVNIIAIGVGATASLVSASISTQLQVMKLQVLVSAGPVAASIAGFQDVGPGVTIGIFIVASTAAVLGQMVIMGYLF